MYKENQKTCLKRNEEVEGLIRYRQCTYVEVWDVDDVWVLYRLNIKRLVSW